MCWLQGQRRTHTEESLSQWLLPLGWIQMSQEMLSMEQGFLLPWSLRNVYMKDDKHPTHSNGTRSQRPKQLMRQTFYKSSACSRLISKNAVVHTICFPCLSTLGALVQKWRSTLGHLHKDNGSKTGYSDDGIISNVILKQKAYTEKTGRA